MFQCQIFNPAAPAGGGAHLVFAALCAMATVEPLAAQTPVCPPTSGAGNPSVLTGQYDNYRDAHNASETCLYSTAIGSGGSVSIAEASFSPLLVDSPSSGSLAGYNPIYAQPLYVPNIAVQHPLRGTCSPSCDMVVIVTAYGSIFAYNADNGNLLWKRTGTGGTAGTNWLWYDDCEAGAGVVGGVGGGSAYIGPGLPFAGIVSTPVIDTNPPSPYTATMFLTSLCQTASPANQQQWWLHEIDLTGLASGHVGGQDISTIQISPTGMNVPNQLQRPALLEVRVTGATPNPLIYVAFGVAGFENVASDLYHGWLMGYTINSSGAFVTPPSLAFITTPTSCGTGGGTTQCSGNGGTPPCDCLVNTAHDPAYQNAPNWGGFGGGIWMSGKGPASRTDSSGLAHTFIGVGNGGFQTGGNSYGDSILDFHLSSGGLGTIPYDFFTPHGGPGDCWETGTCSPVVQVPLSLSSCVYDKQADGTCNHTVELLSEQDWDMAVSGIALFDSAVAGHLAVTVDKAGYGYLLQQDDMQHFASGDPGNQFPFIAVDSPCGSVAADCDRVTSLAFYNNTLFLWPYHEVLKSLQFNGGPTAATGTQIYTDSTGTHVTGTGCSGGGSCPCSGGSCFTHSVIPGDWLIANGCTAPSCPIVTSVTSDTQVTVSPAFAPIPESVPVSYSYNGYFINPTRDTTPISSHVGYPGGSLVVTSNGTTSGTAVVWAIYGGAGSSSENTAGIGYLRAYDVGNLNPGSLTSLWDSGTAGSNPASFDISRFGVPTVAHGTIFVPTYNILNSSVNSSCTSTTPCLGVLVYQGTN
jgi:hypothetical protein